MKYLLLIYSREDDWEEAERDACYVESARLARELAADGRYLSANPLEPVATATSVRVRDGKKLVTNGPFAETHEQLGGYYLIDADDLDEAIDLAERIPSVKKGTIEIRPVHEIPGVPESVPEQRGTPGTASGDQRLPLLAFYGGWRRYQRGLLEMFLPLSDEQLALPMADGAGDEDERTIGLVAQHMVANRVWWFQVWMGEGSPELAPIAHWDPADEVEHPPVGSAALVAGLETTWQMVEGALSRWTAADLDTIFQPPAALRPEEREFFSPVSREWIIWHVFEHEIHHGGEISLALGRYGLLGIYGGM